MRVPYFPKLPNRRLFKAVSASGLRKVSLSDETPLAILTITRILIWEFPKRGDPNIVPIRTPK